MCRDQGLTCPMSVCGGCPWVFLLLGRGPWRTAARLAIAKPSRGHVPVAVSAVADLVLLKMLV